MLDSVGRVMARYLEKPVQGYEPFTPSDPGASARHPAAGRRAAGRRQQPHFRRHQVSDAIDLVACRAVCRPRRRPRDLRRRAAGPGRSQSRRQALSPRRFPNTRRFHTRICRPSGLSAEDRARVCAYAAERIGFDYDLQEHPRPDALPVSDADAAPLAPPHDGDGLGRSVAHHLLGPDRASLRQCALSDPAQDHPGGKRKTRARRSSKSATRRCMRRAISTSRPISRWSSRHCRTASTTGRCNGPTCRWWPRSASTLPRRKIAAPLVPEQSRQTGRHAWRSRASKEAQSDHRAEAGVKYAGDVNGRRCSLLRRRPLPHATLPSLPLPL